MSVGKESSIAVTVRVRPFTSNETAHLRQQSNEPIFLGDGSFAGSGSTTGSNTNGQGSTTDGAPTNKLATAGKNLRKIINVVDDKMLIFDPPESNPLSTMQRAAFPNTTNRIREHRFVFDRLFDENCSQDDVYSHTTKPLIDNILDGYNASVFAYGATGCGKTHTISGNPNDPGIIFLTMKELFQRIDTVQDTKHVDISLSYLEIYNETIRDLLVPSNTKQLILREDSEKKISVSNLSSYRPQSVAEVMDMILQGNQNRTMSPTEANATSSRSHAVLQINVTQKARTAELSEAHTFATLSIIDLAGSERASATKNRGERLMEGANINKSLLALGNCINALCDPRRRGHVPYRDSKLTRLLKFSLGGNCKTVMIVCVSPSSAHYDETLNTLKYADRAKKIKTKVTRNEHNLDRHVASYLKMITEQRAEIEQLRERESKAISQAMEKHEKVREACRVALQEAKDSLETTISKTQESRLQRSKCLSRMRALFSQIDQIESWISTMEGTEIYDDSNYLKDSDEAGGDDEADGNYVNDHLYDLKQKANQLLQKLTNERDSLQLYINGLQDQTAVDSAVESIKRKLQETEGWTPQDGEHFGVYAELQKQKLENASLTESVAEVPTVGSFKALSKVFFETWSGLVKLKNNEEGAKENTDTLEQLLQKMSKACDDLVDSNRFNESIVNMNLWSGTGNSSTATTATTSTSSTISTSNMPPPTPPHKPQTAQPRKKSGFKRPFASSKRHTVVIRSPAPNKKPTKRVRWEDDSLYESDVSMNSLPPSPPKTGTKLSSAKPSSVKTSPPYSSTQSKDDSDTSMNDESSISLPVAPKPSSSTSSPAAMPNNNPTARKKAFGVKGELRKASSRNSVLGMNKRAITKVEKENVDLSSSKHDSTSSPNRRLGMPLRVAVPTAASSMKQVNREGKS